MTILKDKTDIDALDIETQKKTAELKAIDLKNTSNLPRPNQQEAEEAVRTLIRWAGDDPAREGLLETPKRVVKAYKEFFKGYTENAEEILSRTFNDVGGYDDMVMLRGIEMHSHCEHHMVPFIGKVHIAYMPNEKVVGLSKLARIVDTFARRLQTQETMTAQIASAIDAGLNTKGSAVMIEAVHQCMSMRGVQKSDVATITTRFTGIFKDDRDYRDRFMRLAGNE
ncbi:MAG: GTP cyclohydrolase 1 [Rhodomicrobium sp.]|nr:MAG: GTP cyclohydrolase 1 [Rhodomicrobium sp.]